MKRGLCPCDAPNCSDAAAKQTYTQPHYDPAVCQLIRDRWKARADKAEAENAALREQIDRVKALADEWVQAERAADEYGPRSAFTGYDCAEMLLAALAGPAGDAERGSA